MMAAEHKDERVAQLNGHDGMAPDDRVLHLVVKKDHPVALCGYITTDGEWGVRKDTAGWDRCPTCLQIARDQGRSL